jgi:hypothetical protein
MILFVGSFESAAVISVSLAFSDVGSVGLWEVEQLAVGATVVSSPRSGISVSTLAACSWEDGSSSSVVYLAKRSRLSAVSGEVSAEPAGCNCQPPMTGRASDGWASSVVSERERNSFGVA